MAPRDAHTLVTRTCEYVRLHGKRGGIKIIGDIEVDNQTTFMQRDYLDGPSEVTKKRKAEEELQKLTVGGGQKTGEMAM